MAVTDERVGGSSSNKKRKGHNNKSAGGSRFKAESHEDEEDDDEEEDDDDEEDEEEDDEDNSDVCPIFISKLNKPYHLYRWTTSLPEMTRLNTLMMKSLSMKVVRVRHRSSKKRRERKEGSIRSRNSMRKILTFSQRTLEMMHSERKVVDSIGCLRKKELTKKKEMFLQSNTTRSKGKSSKMTESSLWCLIERKLVSPLRMRTESMT